MSDWIALDDFVPEHPKDWDADDQIWVIDATTEGAVKELFTYNQLTPELTQYTHWKPTGCKTTIRPPKRLARVLYARGLVRFHELDAGSLFAFGDCVAIKSEYRTDAGAPQAYILGSGEMFWGGVSTPDELKMLLVQPMDLR